MYLLCVGTYVALLVTLWRQTSRVLSTSEVLNAKRGADGRDARNPMQRAVKE